MFLQDFCSIFQSLCVNKCLERQLLVMELGCLKDNLVSDFLFFILKFWIFKRCERADLYF